MVAKDRMKAAVLVAPLQFAIEQVERPECGKDDVLICVDRCCICGTDVHIFKGHYSSDHLPMIPGHEFSGRIAAVGANVEEFYEGQKVVADINVGCGHCFYCRRNQILNCPSMQQIGIHKHGAFAEYVSIPARLVIPVPDSMSLDLAALTEPLACVVRAAKKISLGIAECVLVMGAGPIGNLHVQLARTIGAAPIIVSDPSEYRSKLAKECGADVIVTNSNTLRDVVFEATEGRGADVVIESVGALELYEEALKLVRPGGRVLAFGITDAAATISLSPFEVVLKELGIQGSVAGMGEDMHQALRLLSHERINTTPFRSEVWPLQDIQKAMENYIEKPGALKVQVAIH